MVVTHGSKPLAGIEGRSARVRRFESNISDLDGETLWADNYRQTCPDHPAGAARSEVRPGGSIASGPAGRHAVLKRAAEFAA
jgi:hypothetical protein